MSVRPLLLDLIAGVEEPCLGGSDGADAGRQSRHGDRRFVTPVMVCTVRNSYVEIGRNWFLVSGSEQTYLQLIAKPPY